MHHNNKTLLIIDHQRYTHLPRNTWIRFTLPILLSTFTGKKEIDSIIITAVTPSVVSFVNTILLTMTVDAVLIPEQTESLFSTSVKDKKVTMLPISSQTEHQITLDKHNWLTLTTRRQQKKPYLCLTHAHLYYDYQ